MSAIRLELKLRHRLVGDRHNNQEENFRVHPLLQVLRAQNDIPNRRQT